MNPLEKSLIGVGALLLICVITSKGANRFGIPALLVFLGIGMVTGEQGPGGIPFNDYHLSQTLGVIALTFILFAGGLDTQFKVVAPVTRSALALSTLGVAITTTLVGCFASLFLHFSPLEGLLLGATVSSTDVVAVFTVLRARSVSFKNEKIRSLLELESGLNDPMAVFLSVGFLQLIELPDTHWTKLIPMFFQQMSLGLLFGVVAGKIIVLLINRLELEFEGLYPVLSVSLVLITYGATQLLGGSGFLAAYVSGLVLGNHNFLHRKSLTHFHDGIAWLMQIAMFLTMGLLVFPNDLAAVTLSGLLVSAFLVFVARPISVWFCLIPTRFTFKEKMMVSWAGLRGAAPIILSTYPLLVGIPKAHTIFNLVFFVVFISVLLQGATIPKMAKWLGLAGPRKEKSKFPIEYNPTRNLKNELIEIFIFPSSKSIGKSLIDLGLPSGALVVLIQRGEETLVPRGGTRIHPEDTLLILAAQENLPQIHSKLVG